MPYRHSDPARADDPHALPNIEVFYVTPGDAAYNQQNADHGTAFTLYAPGWYWWACFPGCLPDGEPSGPYATEADALADAQESETGCATCADEGVVERDRYVPGEGTRAVRQPCPDCQEDA